MGPLFSLTRACAFRSLVIGSMLASDIAGIGSRAIALIYALALGVAATCGRQTRIEKKGKPWRTLLYQAAVLYYGFDLEWLCHRGLLHPVLCGALSGDRGARGIFLFSYNFEAFGGRFHNNFGLPCHGDSAVLAGYVMQANSISILALGCIGRGGPCKLCEIRISRPTSS